MLAVKINPSASIIVVLASFANFLISFIHLCTSIIISNPFSILWYSLDQSSLSLFITYAWSMLFNFLDMYGFGDVGVVV